MIAKDTLTMTVEEFENLDEVEQARARALAFIANKQWGESFSELQYFRPVYKSGIEAVEASQQVVKLAKMFLDTAGDSFIGRAGGYDDLLQLLVESTKSDWGWSRASVSAVLVIYLDEYTINHAQGTIVHSSN